MICKINDTHLTSEKLSFFISKLASALKDSESSTVFKCNPPSWLITYLSSATDLNDADLEAPLSPGTCVSKGTIMSLILRYTWPLGPPNENALQLLYLLVIGSIEIR